MPLAFVEVRAGVARACTAVVVVGCALAACGTANSSPAGPNPQQQCVQAVFGVLSGMTDRPYDGRPFADFVTRYGTRSVTYSAYLDVFTSFRTMAGSQGVRTAEDRLRTEVTKDCADAS